MRIAFGGISHETSTFANTRTTVADFEAGFGLYRGNEIFERFRGANICTGGFIEGAAKHKLELVPLLWCFAYPSGVITTDAYAVLKSEFLERLRAEIAKGPLDGVLLDLHGAMVVEGIPDGDGDIVAAVRDVVGPACPIVVTFDLHGNHSALRVASANAIVGFDTYPHVDMAERGREAVDLLVATMRGEINRYTARPLTLLIAGAVTVLLALGVIWWASRRLLRAQPRALLAGSLRTEKKEKKSRFTRGWRFLPIGVATALAAGLLSYTPRVAQHIAPLLFFGAAFLILIDGVRLLHARLRKAEATPAPDGLASVWAMGVRNTVRRRGRSAALTGLLALGVFMVTALNAFRQDARLTNNTRDSGAGGFTFIGESTLPVYEDLNSNAGQKAWDFDPEELEGVKFTPFRVRDGEEASCLNLNRAQTPRVLGVNPAALPADAFPFASETTSGARWEILRKREGDAINVIVDQISATYAMGKGQGDILTVPDGQGRPVKLRIAALLAGTVLQGNVLMDEEAFIRLYPDTRGYRYFLIDAPARRAESFRKLAVEQLTSRGFTLSSAPERLAQFQAVQNTYLTIFSTLGGMALLLSTIGLAILVARHVLERRAEFATLTACGFLPGQLRLMVLAEHWFLLLAAVVLGSATALLAVWPNLRLAGAGGLPAGTLALILLGLLPGGLVFCWLAARLAVSKRLITALRHE